MNSHGLPRLSTIEDIPVEDRNPTLVLLLEICHRQQKESQHLRDEIARLKGQKGKPVIRPSALEGNDRSAKQRQAPGIGDQASAAVLVHVLCWVHAECNLVKLVGFNDAQRQALAAVRSQVWALYDALKAFKLNPSQSERARVEAFFDSLCTTRTCSES